MASTSGAADDSESVPTSRATCQDMLGVSAHRIAEIVDGTLNTPPRPAMRPARASSSPGAKVGGLFDCDAGGPGGWWLVDEPDLNPDEDIPVPDLAGRRGKRMPGHSAPACVTPTSEARQPRHRSHL